MSKIVITLKRDVKSEDTEIIREGLRTHNRKFTPSDLKSFALYAHDAAGTLVGGIMADSFWGWLFIEILWVHENVRGTGLGKDLLARAEAEGRALGCKAVYLDTFSFQARPFYESQGYSLCGLIDEFPAGHQRYYLAKRFDGAEMPEPTVERVTEYPGYLARFTPAHPGRGAVLLLHGFPANSNVKNLDLALYLQRHTDRTVYQLHYRGLGESRGSFRFTDSIAEAIDVVDRLATKHQPLTLVGHSWGGLVSVNALKARPDKIDGIILLSPFVDAQPGDPIEDWITAKVKEECPDVFGVHSDAAIRADYETVRAKHLPSLLFPQLDGKIGIIQARDDETTTAATMRALLPKFRRAPKYVEIPFDHSFTADVASSRARS